MFCPTTMTCEIRAIRAVTIGWAFRRMLDGAYGPECDCNRVRQRALHEYGDCWGELSPSRAFVAPGIPAR